MLHTLSERLSRSAESLARLEKLERRLRDLEPVYREAGTVALRLKAQLSKEESDIDRLEGFSLSGLLMSVWGTKDERLRREREEAAAVRLKYEEARQHAEDLQKEMEQIRADVAALGPVRQEYEGLLAQKADAIAREGAAEYFRLSEREQQASWQLQQIEEALAAGNAADSALGEVEKCLDSASGWGTWDMLGGGMIATAMKHSRIDDAQKAAHRAQQALGAFSRELKDVNASISASDMQIDGFSRFADYFFDGLFMDRMVQNRIKEMQERVRTTRRDVQGAVAALRTRRTAAQTARDVAARERALFVERYRPD